MANKHSLPTVIARNIRITKCNCTQHKNGTFEHLQGPSFWHVKTTKTTLGQCRLQRLITAVAWSSYQNSRRSTSRQKMCAMTYSEVGRIQSMLLVFVGAIDVTLAKCQDFVRAWRRRWQLPRTVVEPRSWQLTTYKIRPRQVEMVGAVDAPRTV